MVIRVSAVLSTAIVLSLAFSVCSASAEETAPAKKEIPNYSEMWEWDPSKGEERDRMGDHTACRAVGDQYTGLQRLGGYRGCMTKRGWKYTGPQLSAKDKAKKQAEAEKAVAEAKAAQAAEKAEEAAVAAKQAEEAAASALAAEEAAKAAEAAEEKAE